MSDDVGTSNITISEMSDDEIIDPTDDLIKQNEELLKKLALAENTLERKKGFKKNGEPRKKAEMTPARKRAIEKMKEGRKKWLEQKRIEKEMTKPLPKKVLKMDKKTRDKYNKEAEQISDEIIIESESEEEIIQKPKPKKPKKKKKVKKIIVEPETESSSEEEEVIIVKAPRRRRKRVIPPKRKVIYEDESTSDEEIFEVPNPQPQKDNGYGGIKFR